MNDKVLDGFVKNLLNMELDVKRFEQNIDLFSRYIGYTNLDYKYNGTYLSNYISGFVELTQKLVLKNGIYYNVFEVIYDVIFGFDCEYEVILDRSFSVSCKERNIRSGYIGLDDSKITSSKIEVRVTFYGKERDFTFCKEYEEMKEKMLLDFIKSDISGYVKGKFDVEDKE